MNGGTRLLVAEPDAKAREALGRLLDDAGYAIAPSDDGTEALRLFYRERPDAVLLGLDVSNTNGWDALTTIRELSDVPVLVIGEGESEGDRVRALRTGADDFVSRPFGRAEIVARVEALLRRPRAADAPSLFEDEFVQIDHRRHEVRARGAEVALTPLEFRMLAAFARNAGQALTHSQLLSMVWGEGERDRREVKLYVSYLRRKLRRAGVEPIETVRGVGYRYEPRDAPELAASG